MSKLLSGRRIMAIAVVASAAAIYGCGGGGGSGSSSTAIDTIPVDAGTVPSAFVSFLRLLTANMNEIGEGLGVTGLGSPGDDTSEPIALGA